MVIRGNSVYANTGLGIDLGDDGATANNGYTGGGQPNRGIDSPVFASAILSGGMLTVAGYVGRPAGQSTFAGATVDVYAAEPDPSGRGEGAPTSARSPPTPAGISAARSRPPRCRAATRSPNGHGRQRKHVGVRHERDGGDPAEPAAGEHRPRRANDTEDTTVVFAGPAATRSRSADPDAGGATVRVTLGVTSGALCRVAVRPDVHPRRRHGRRQHDVQRHGRRGQRRAQRPRLHARRRLSGAATLTVTTNDWGIPARAGRSPTRTRWRRRHAVNDAR